MKTSCIKVNVFWNYFQRWKAYYPMEQAEKKRILSWAEKRYIAERMQSCRKASKSIRRSCVLLAMVGEIQGRYGNGLRAREKFCRYKENIKTFFVQKEMKYYFDVSECQGVCLERYFMN
ncbi:MAG: hypothetical protein ACLTMH_17530 [Faecalimonas umbilicata]|uniref:hypothetical protein n=1 Tax=Faecalimonas umbilicata TaxID=1912855 RepID=UPI003994E03C